MFWTAWASVELSQGAELHTPVSQLFTEGTMDVFEVVSRILMISTTLRHEAMLGLLTAVPRAVWQSCDKLDLL